MNNIPGTPDQWSKWMQLCRDSVAAYREMHRLAELERDDIYQGYWDVHVEMAASDPKTAAIVITCLMHLAAEYTEV